MDFYAVSYKKTLKWISTNNYGQAESSFMIAFAILPPKKSSHDSL